jgi:glycosyltransferase involved in cell wall biosynthesis
VSDTVAQNVNGFLTESKDPEVFYGFLKTLLDDYNLYQRMARENHQKAITEYSSDKVREKIFSVYQMILGKPLNYARSLG